MRGRVREGAHEKVRPEWILRRIRPRARLRFSNSSGCRSRSLLVSPGVEVPNVGVADHLRRLVVHAVDAVGLALHSLACGVVALRIGAVGLLRRLLALGAMILLGGIVDPLTRALIQLRLRLTRVPGGQHRNGGRFQFSPHVPEAKRPTPPWA